MLDFKTELYKKVELIKSKSLVKTVKEILDAADKGFWLDPCSGTGKYHPPEDQGYAGLTRHLIKATEVFEQEARRLMFNDYEFDAGMAATILHDVEKNGNPWGEETDYRHGILGAEFIKKFHFSNKITKQLVMDAVRYHMSPWNTTIGNKKMRYAKENPETMFFSYKEIMEELKERTKGLQVGRVEKAVQDADYWASREGMSYYPGQSIMPDPRKHDTPIYWAREILDFNNMLGGCGGDSGGCGGCDGGCDT